MDADFEQQYQAAERAYGLGEYTAAHALASELWDQLQSASEENDQSLVLGWRTVVSLLLGHIQLHGLHQPEQAALAYQRVLDSEPDATITALAEQGLERCRSQNAASEAVTTPARKVAIPDLLKDPFLTTDSDQSKTERTNQATAMPWLASTEEPQPIPTPTQAPDPTLEPTVTPEADEAVEMPTPKPESRSEQQATEQPSRNAVEHAPPETSAKDLLKTSWLRVQLKPEPSSPTDSIEPMGLIHKIKRAFAHSAGR